MPEVNLGDIDTESEEGFPMLVEEALPSEEQGNALSLDGEDTVAVGGAGVVIATLPPSHSTPHCFVLACRISYNELHLYRS